MLTLAAGSMLDADAHALCDAAAAAGFDGVGLRLSGEHRVDAAALARLGRRLRELDLTLLDAEVHRIVPGASPPDQLIETAAALGARHLLVVSDLPDASATEEALGEVVTRCEAAGLRVGLEYMAWTTPSSPGAAAAMARATGALVVVDLLHHVRVGAGPAELAELVAAGLVGWVQLCDAPAEAPADLLHEARHARRAPGEGALALDALLAVLPPEVPISVEVQSDALARELAPPERARHLAACAHATLSR